MAAPVASPILAQFRTGLVPAPNTAVGALLTDSGWSSQLTVNPVTGLVTLSSGNLNIVGGQLQLNGVNQLQSGTFVGTLTGCTTVVTGTFHYTIAGGVCTISLANLSNVTGTSNSTAMTLTGLPAVCQPATQNPFVPCVFEDNTALAGGFAEVAPGSGTITFFKASVSGANIVYSATGFTASGTKGMDATVITYSLQ